MSKMLKIALILGLSSTVALNIASAMNHEDGKMDKSHSAKEHKMKKDTKENKMKKDTKEMKKDKKEMKKDKKENKMKKDTTTEMKK